MKPAAHEKAIVGACAGGAESLPYSSDRKVVILSRSFGQSSDEPIRYLQSHGFDCELIRNNEPGNTEAIAAYIHDADAVIVGSDIIDEYVLERCPNLKVISKHGVGLDNVDLDAARARDIRVTITTGANNETVADLTLLLILALRRNLKLNMIDSESPDWTSKALSRDLYAAKVGLIGFGNIGAAVARRLVGFDCEIYVYDPYIDPKTIDTPKTRIVPFEELLDMCDVISLHLPLNDKTAGIIDADAIARMKKDAILINTSRGGLMDYTALYQALVSGHLRGAGLDVYTTEPPVNEPLLALENVIATPHIATHTAECNCRMGMMAAANVVIALAVEE